MGRPPAVDCPSADHILENLTLVLILYSVELLNLLRKKKENFTLFLSVSSFQRLTVNGVELRWFVAALRCC